MCQHFNIGDTVAYSTNYLLATGQLAGRGHRRGTIADFEGNRDFTLAIVEWQNGTLSHVHINNLAKPGSNERFIGATNA